MSQLALSFSAPLSRRTDPETSHVAAEKSADFRAKHEARIFGAIFDAGEKGATYKEIAAATGLEPVAVARRLKGMERRGLIERWLVEDFGKYESRDGMAIWWAT